MAFQIQAAVRLAAAARVIAGKDDASILKFLSGAITQKLDKADVKTLTYKVSGKKITLRGFGAEVVVTQKLLDRFSWVNFTLDDVEAYLAANGAKPFNAGKSRPTPPLYD